GADRGRLRADHHRDRAPGDVLLRRGLPPAVPVQGAGRLLRYRWNRGGLPGGTDVEGGVTGWPGPIHQGIGEGTGPRQHVGSCTPRRVGASTVGSGTVPCTGARSTPCSDGPRVVHLLPDRVPGRGRDLPRCTPNFFAQRKR